MAPKAHFFGIELATDESVRRRTRDCSIHLDGIARARAFLTSEDQAAIRTRYAACEWQALSSASNQSNKVVFAGSSPSGVTCSTNQSRFSGTL
jgi:hypothetical protein